MCYSVTTCLFYTHVLKKSNTASAIDGRRVHLVSPVKQGSNIVIVAYGIKRGREDDAPRPSELVDCAHTAIYNTRYSYMPTSFCLNKPIWTAVPECRKKKSRLVTRLRLPVLEQYLTTLSEVGDYCIGNFLPVKLCSG